MKWIKAHLSSIILTFTFLLGLSLLLYPSVSDYWNSFHQTRAIASYTDKVVMLDDEEYEKIWDDAVKYNLGLIGEQKWVFTEEEKEEYNALLNVSGNGIMGYVEIPSINVSLPIYHGVDEAVLQIAIGHIEGSSLPVGGANTHCVISGHRGLPSAKLFTNLDQVKEGDLFMLQILDETLTYEVDQIRIVEPADLTNVVIEENQDLCTLVTCTPYGVNSHRLLVRGHRVANANGSDIRITADAMQIDPMLVAPAVAVPILFVLLVWLLVRYRKQKE